ncbi:MAG TPA: indole-3-glycerol phosphate synthase TrpC [Actinomycetota bacterium]|nr:indole-3-glycerol phosphate synthase TrpC [Actinomycetota bacterium]
MSFLSELLASTRVRVEEARAKLSDVALEQRIASIPPALDFAGTLRGDELSFIAEIKRATPSKGPLDLDLDAGGLAAAYAKGGAAAISVLTEPEYFKGSLEDLEAARVVPVPLLRKDFVIDPFQLLEARAAGADSVLLIVRVVGDGLAALLAGARALGMEPLVEVFHEDEVERAVDAGANVIGINHRDLESFEVDARRTAKLAPLVPEGVLVVAASGVSTRTEVEELRAAGAHAVLVGESLVRAQDPAAKLRELRGL